MHNRIISVVLCAKFLKMTKCEYPSQYDTFHCGDVNQTDVYFNRQNVGILVSVRRHYLNINFTFQVLSVGYTAHMHKGKAFLFQPWTGSMGSRMLRLPEIVESRHMKVVWLSAHAPAAFTPRKYSCHAFLLDTESIPEPYCGERFNSTKNLNNPIENRTRDLVAFSTVPKPTAQPRLIYIYIYIYICTVNGY
jgi:hypothetical protein